MGELSVFETWAPPHCCGSWLRPKLLPPIGSSPGRMRFWFLLLCPFFFGSLWAGNQVTGVTGDGGWGDAVGRKNSLEGARDAPLGTAMPTGVVVGATALGGAAMGGAAMPSKAVRGP